MGAQTSDLLGYQPKPYLYLLGIREVNPPLLYPDVSEYHAGCDAIRDLPLRLFY